LGSFQSFLGPKRSGKVDNFKYENFKNLTLKKLLKSGELKLHNEELNWLSVKKMALGMSAPGRVRERDG